MATDKSLLPFEDEEMQDAVDIEIVNPEAVSIETPDGGALVILGPEASEKLMTDFSENLAEVLDEGELVSIATELLGSVDDDLHSRDDWEMTYKKGLDLIGLKIEERTTPWPGACGVFHPILGEAAVRFQSQSIMETFPAGGPVKTKIIGKITREKEKQAQRVKEDLNYFLTEKMTEYRIEHERMLFTLPLAGMAFKKVYYDPSLGRPTSVYVPAEDIIVPYGATDLQSAPRYAHRMRKFPNEVRKLQASGFYRDIDLTTPIEQVTEVQLSKDKLSGSTQAANDDRHILLEYHVDYDLPGFEDKKDGEPTGVALPYVITIDAASHQILSIYRNWREDDEFKVKRQHFVPYHYIPGFGFYSFGLIHLIGGLAKSSTSLLRQLIDAGTLSNLPAGLKARGLRIKGDSTPLMPGEFRDVDVPSGAIKDAITFLPYKEPSQVLTALLGTLVEEGRRFASIADMEIGDANQQAPVGTTLALMERAMKVMSAVQARLHASLKQELDLIVDIIKNHLPPEYDYEVDGYATRASDYDGRVDIAPVTDPNAASLSQRVVQYQAALQLAAQAPDIYDLPELHRQMLVVLGIKDVEKIIPDSEDFKPLDPVSENMAILTGKPVRAFIGQNHEAHLQVHMMAMQDPKILEMVGQSPQAAVIQAAAQAHVAEHIAFQYRREIEIQLGAPLPEMGEELPENIERDISQLMAMAAAKLLEKDKAEAQQKQAQQQMQDPVIQMRMQELQIAKSEADAKVKKVDADIQAAQERLALEKARIESNERLQMAQLQNKSEKDKAEIVAKGIELGHEIKSEDELNRASKIAEGIRLGTEIRRVNIEEDRAEKESDMSEHFTETEEKED